MRKFVMGHLGTGKKTKARAKNIKLAPAMGWNADMQTHYGRLKQSLVAAVKRAHMDYNKVIVLMWDASKYAWSYTITQVDPEQLALPWDEQKHEILVTH